MATKSEMESLVSVNLPSAGGGIPSLNHRDVLKEEDASIIENFYADEKIDTEVTTNVLTAENVANIYTMRILKLGRRVTITGSFTGMSNQFGIMFDVTTAEFTPPLAGLYFGTGKTFAGDTIQITLNGTSFIALGLLPTETVQFSITYNTQS